MVSMPVWQATELSNQEFCSTAERPERPTAVSAALIVVRVPAEAEVAAARWDMEATEEAAAATEAPGAAIAREAAGQALALTAAPAPPA